MPEWNPWGYVQPDDEPDEKDRTIAALRAALDGLLPFVELRPHGRTGLNQEIPWFQHGGISHGEGREADCLACRAYRAALATAKVNPLSNFGDDENDRMPWQQDEWSPRRA